MWGPAARIGARLDEGLIVPEGRLGWSLAVVGTALGAYFTRDSTPLSIAIGTVMQVAGGLLVFDAIRVFRRGEHLVPFQPDAPRRTRRSRAARHDSDRAMDSVDEVGTALVTHGPFRWVRHPYYFGVLLLLLGAIVALRAWPALILFLVAVRLTVKRARAEEHNLRLEFGPAYETYAARVPFLLPLGPPLPPGGLPAVEAASRGLLGALAADGPDDGGTGTDRSDEPHDR